ncbi:MAG: hypothetical protein DYG90_12250 [Chloroflexi bacterium CFX6]|nr:hypothetical protein [Chloroflexi bacterium CFX6]
MATQSAQTRPSRIPEFASREEEAEFWDNHDFSEFEDELKSVKVRFAKRLSQGLAVRFDEETLEALRTQAKRKGIGPTTLVRMWVIERLRKEVSQTGA